MNLEQAKHRFLQQAIHLFRTDGIVGVSLTKDGLVKIGDGFTITSNEADEILGFALDIAIKGNINVRFN